MEIIGGILALTVVFGIYFLPAIVASKNKKSNADSVALLNLFLGWTLIGWVVALVWATTTDAPKPVVMQKEAPSTTADELLKLKALLDNDAITQSEYDTQKAKLLA